jgi:hypothetical protein
MYGTYLNYDPLQLTYTVGVDTLNKNEDGRGSKLTDPVKNMSLFFSPFRRSPFFFVSFTRRFKPNLCISLSTHKATENHCIISLTHTHTHTHKMTAQCVLTGTYRVTGHKQRTFDFPQRKKRTAQGQLKTPQSITVSCTLCAPK